MVRKSSQMPLREHNETRIRRVRSWLDLSQKSKTTHDEKFIFLWIAFNAAYGTELSDASNEDRVAERDRFVVFVTKIVEQDHKEAIKKIFYEEFTNPIRRLKDNEYVFGPF